MKFRTEISPEPAPFQIVHSNQILTLGSCFAQHINHFFQRYRFTAMHNPFGVLYNPASIAQSVKLIQDRRRLVKGDLVYHNEEWHNFYFDSAFSDPDSDRCLEGMNKAISDTGSFIKSADIVIITYGTSYVYSYRKNGNIVSNCHKIPAREFTHFMLSPEEVRRNIYNIISIIRSMNPQIKFIFTVSPVRHWKDGAVDNQISKATLLLAVHEIIKSETDIHYFPAYEILMDDLRDYRFYERDLIHPNQLAVEYIWEKFSKTFMSGSQQILIRDLEKIAKAREHRPRNRQSDAYRLFLQKQLDLIEKLCKEHSHLDLLEDRKYFNLQLERTGRRKK